MLTASILISAVTCAHHHISLHCTAVCQSCPDSQESCFKPSCRSPRKACGGQCRSNNLVMMFFYGLPIQAGNRLSHLSVEFQANPVPRHPAVQPQAHGQDFPCQSS
eukprot:3274758-Amphidinium_carterae.1